MNEKDGWIFPPTNWGTESGKNDPGLETFRGNPYPALAREPIQNSIDARKDPTKPVRVNFSTFKIKKEEFPNRAEYMKVLEQCISTSKKGSETEKEMKNALNELNKEEIDFIQISDYNTTGLSGSDQLRDSDWHRLIKVVGDSDKEETSGGAFGIGKHAPFVCSNLKVVFYSTIDTEDKFAFQGVAKLITYTDENGEPRQATGFFGEKDKVQPIKQKKDLSTTFINKNTRTEAGTDLYVAGFDYRSTWKEELIEAVISSFFVAIYEGSLEVNVGGTLISKETLHERVEELKVTSPKNRVINYYEVLTSVEPFIEEDFHGLGEIKFYVSNNINYHRKVAMVRKTGMVIKEKPNNNTPEKYAGVLLIKGAEFNKELKRVENPTHTDWELKRKKDVKKIKATLKALDEWMNKMIKSISPLSDATQLDVEELSQFLPDDYTEAPIVGNDQSNDEGLKRTPLPTVMKKKKTTSNKPQKPSLPTSDFENEEDSQKGTEDASTSFDTSNDDSTRSPSNKQNDTDHKERPNDAFEDTSNDTLISNPRKNAAVISRYKLFCPDPDLAKYKLNLNVKKAGDLLIKLYVSGEDSNELADIALASKDGNPITLDNGTIGPIHAEEGMNHISFELNENIRVAMEVVFNEK